MVGNIATSEAMIGLGTNFHDNIDAVKVGMGPGHACTTRKKTGVGIGQYTAITEVVKVAKKWGIPVCADGGIYTSGDFAKAIGAGASSIMSGHLLAHAEESPGWEQIGGLPIHSDPLVEMRHIFKPERWRKFYKGSAHFDYKDPDAPDYKVSEGRKVLLTKRKPLEEIIIYLLGGLRSAMSMSDAHNIKEFHEKVQFKEGNLIRETPNT